MTKLKIICNPNQEIVDDIECYKFNSTSKTYIYNFVKEILKGIRRDVIEIDNAIILNSFNNCLMRFVVKDELEPDLDEPELLNIPALNPDDVEIYDLINGELVSIKNEHGTVGENQFNLKMGLVMDDYFSLLNYFK